MAAGQTYVPIASTILGSTAASYTFSSIPQTYTDLVFVSSGITANVGEPIVRINGDSGTNYSRTYFYGDGTTAYSYRDLNTTLVKAIYQPGTSTLNIDILNFMNYSNTTTYKTILSRDNQIGGVGGSVNLWRNTAAITSISIATATANNFNIGTSFALYGIAAA